MKTYSVKIQFSRPLDYDGLSDEVIIWALKRYEEEIAEYRSFPRWKRCFLRNPDPLLRRTYDDLFFDPPVWYMELKTIEGIYSIAGVRFDGSSLCKYMEEEGVFYCCGIDQKVIKKSRKSESRSCFSLFVPQKIKNPL